MSHLGTYRLRLGFSSGVPIGYFQVGVSQIGMGDVLGWDFLTGYGGPYDDVTLECTDFTLNRGRDNEHDPMPAGTLDLTLFDRNGKFNPKNASSPLYGRIRPLIPCLLELQVAGVWYELFHGWLDEESSHTDFGEKRADLRFTDMFVWLERAKTIIIAATGQTTVGAAIGEILDSIEWTAPDYRDLQIGSPVADFSAIGDKAGTDLVTGLLEMDRGAFFSSRTGAATYKDRYEPYRAVSSATYNVAGVLIPGVSLSTVRNRSRVTREGGAQQTWEDADSIAEFGYSDWPEITSPYFLDDAHALELAKWLVWKGRGFTSNVWSMEVQEGTSAAELASIAQTDLLQRVTVNTSAVADDYIVQKIIHKGGGGQVHKMSLVLSEAPTEEAFIIGSSLLGSTTDVLVT